MGDIPTLTDTLAKIRKNHGTRPHVRVQARDIDTGDPAGILELPAFLYRGEADASWDATESSMERLRKNGGLSEEDKRHILDLTSALDAHIQKWFKLPKPLSAGLLQHYSLPTELIDVSPALEVAAFFAAYENTSGTGSITVFPTERLTGCAMVADLTLLDFAERPVSQKGYGVFHNSFRNLRAEGFREVARPERHTFRVTQADAATFVRGQPNLYNPYVNDLDPARAVVTHLIDRYSERVEALPPAAAGWLANRVPPTPLTVRGGAFHDDEAVLNLKRRDDAPTPYRREYQSEQSRKRWSGGG